MIHKVLVWSKHGHNQLEETKDRCVGQGNLLGKREESYDDLVMNAEVIFGELVFSITFSLLWKDIIASSFTSLSCFKNLVSSKVLVVILSLKKKKLKQFPNLPTQLDPTGWVTWIV